MWADSRGTMSRFRQTRKKSRLPFASVHLVWCVIKKKQQQRTGLARAGSNRLSAYHAQVGLQQLGGAWKRWWPVCRIAVLLSDGCGCRCCYCCRCCFVVCLCLLTRVDVLFHPRSMVLGRACGMPPTGTNIVVLALKTELTAESSYTEQLDVVRLGVGMMVWVPYYCFAAVYCLSLPLLLLL